MNAPRFRSAAQSDVGRQRETNEDAYVHRPADGLFAVIDGVGGYAGGEVAAAEARRALVRRLRHRTGTAEVRLREAVVLANNQIYERSRREADLAEMACVLTAAVVEDGRVHAAHVGDTRLYKIRAGAAEKLTHDHSFVGVREDAGELSEEEAMAHPRRHEILRDVGSAAHEADDPSFVEYVEAVFEDDAALLLCSDGLSDLVTVEEIVRLVERYAGYPEQAVQHLIDRANDAGGTDNITIVLVEGELFAAEKGAATEAAVEAVAPTAARFSRLIYFAGGMALMLALFLIAAFAWGWFSTAPPVDALATTGDDLRAQFARADDDAVAWTAPVPLGTRLTLERALDGTWRLAPPADVAGPDSLAGPRLRGFVVALPPTDSLAAPLALGLLLDAAPDSTTLHLTAAADSLQ